MHVRPDMSRHPATAYYRFYLDDYRKYPLARTFPIPFAVECTAQGVIRQRRGGSRVQDPAFHPRCTWSRERYEELRRVPRSKMSTLKELNADVWRALTGLEDVFIGYVELLSRAEKFIEDVTARAGNGYDRLQMASLLVDYTSMILREEQGGVFERLLNCQRIDVYVKLDIALLRICLDEWECNEDTASQVVPWHIAIAPLAQRLSEHIDKFPEWAQADLVDLRRLKRIDERKWASNGAWMEWWYFAKTRKFLEESLQIYWVKRKVHACIKERLPEELTDLIVTDILEHEGLPSGRLRTRFFPKKKDKDIWPWESLRLRLAHTSKKNSQYSSGFFPCPWRGDRE
ncbi:hypothetical protein EJ04DRAFT_244107 [Polyplosphaeria fusca]|uniref:Uncharacterized protein n=1 Tax=Polyplosphaeria fusca TaxID=682080 RepID=A0A9P4R0G4_9PLEO|nr:hypothetical protein EJ04DRAFT_244107 [Polyplosphaeria fusca]